MAALEALNISYEMNITPSRKRKRQFDKIQQELKDDALKTTAATSSCFTNAAFSSTPKKILRKRHLQLDKNKENEQIFPKIGLEVKSIAEIAKQLQEDASSNIPTNPFEVIRKPPKKKKRHADEKACFENAALNLELPEKQFNPYEVVREANSNKIPTCFTNPALNLKVQDSTAIRNPYEVHRYDSHKTEIAVPEENATQSIVTQSKPCNLEIGLPFVPTVGCRIDFRDISMSQLTPSKLLAEKLVFSPAPKGKISLGSIGEETTMDIGKELDCYQLELENSMNEAKLRKNGIKGFQNSPTDYSSYPIQVVDIKKTIKCNQKLSGISEDVENEAFVEETSRKSELNPITTEIKLTSTNPFLYDMNSELQKTQTAEVVEIETENLDDLYGCAENDGEEDSFDFKAPATFVRAYTKAAAVSKLTVSRESLKSNKSNNTNDEDNKKTANVKNIIRKSIRKLMHPHQQNNTEDHSPDKQKHETQNGFLNTIRQSLRRKAYKNILEEESITATAANENEVSIIDSTERTMKLKSDQIQTEFVRVEDLTNEKKHNLRNSIRKSTREVRNQFMKTVFLKKHEEYDFNKS